MDSNNYRNRVLQRLAPELEIPKLTFQVISEHDCDGGQKKGTTKDIQVVLRHSRTATTTDVYMQEIPESAQKTVDTARIRIHMDARFGALFHTQDFLEGRKAEAERRKPVYQGK